MISIILTKEHKSMLLEMANFFFKDMHFNHIDYDGNVCNKTEYDKSVFCINKIHWFEFCMTYLMYKILILWKKNNINGYIPEVTDFIPEWAGCSKHPVDYLYEKFKIYAQI